MKTPFAAALLFFSTTAFAAPNAIVCQVGKMGYDNFQQVTISKSGVDFQFHETSFAVPSKGLVRNGNSIAILNKTVKGSVEGDTFTAKIDSLLVYIPSKKTLQATVLLDGNPDLPGKTLKCK